MKNLNIDVNLINMPFASLVKPVLALGLIKSSLAQHNITCYTHYFNLDFAQILELEKYELLLSIKRAELQLNEWLFTKEAWGKEFYLSEDKTLDLAMKENPILKNIGFTKKWLSQIRNISVPKFLDECVKKIGIINNGNPKIAAFSSLYFQNIPVIALIKRLKKAYPDITIVCGGPNFHGKMGEEFIIKIDEIDVVSTGEADDIFVPLFKALINKDKINTSDLEKSLSNLQGIIFRNNNNKICYGKPAKPVSTDVLNSMPDPDYEDYFEAVKNTSLYNDHGWKRTGYIPFESSRGCWKGDIQHCAFCGLNHQGLGFRAKKPEIVESMLRSFAQKYPLRRLHATDNILPKEYMDTLFYNLSKNKLPEDISLYWETRSNLKRADFSKLAKGGLKIIQTGIENLDTDLLNLIRKGVRGIDNIFFLKLARTFGIHVLWFFLAGIPGEDESQYKKMSALIPKIIHFQPPFQGIQYLELHKFSPYFNEIKSGKRNWATGVKPRVWYNSLYPDDMINIDKIAYFYDAEWTNINSKNKMNSFCNLLKLWIDIWQKSPRLPKLEYSVKNNNNIVINDSRSSTRIGQWELDQFESVVYMIINDPVNILIIEKKLIEKGFYKIENNVKSCTASHTEIENTLKAFVKSGLAVNEKNTYLGLALPKNCFEASLAWRYRETRFETSHTYKLI